MCFFCRITVVLTVKPVTDYDHTGVVGPGVRCYHLHARISTECGEDSTYTATLLHSLTVCLTVMYGDRRMEINIDMFIERKREREGEKWGETKK